MEEQCTGVLLSALTFGTFIVSCIIVVSVKRLTVCYNLFQSLFLIQFRALHTSTNRIIAVKVSL